MKWMLSPLAALALLGCSRDTAADPPAPEAAVAQPAGLSRVTDASRVCMMNDQVMGKPQIPVEVDGRTYYGCCAMCEAKLRDDPASRVAIDPVTGQQVDKATAVIVQDAAGRVRYFASEDTLRRFRG